jgi:hypothetical protein
MNNSSDTESDGSSRISEILPVISAIGSSAHLFSSITPVSASAAKFSAAERSASGPPPAAANSVRARSLAAASTAAVSGWSSKESNAASTSPSQLGA